MSTNTQTRPTGVRIPPKTNPQAAKQSQPLSMRADVNWLNPDKNGSIRATATLTIGGAFAVHGVKVVSGSNGDFVSMPSYKSGSDFKDIFHAVTKGAREQMNNTVMAAYEQKLAQTQEQTQSQGYGSVVSDQPVAAAAEEGQPVMQM